MRAGLLCGLTGWLEKHGYAVLIRVQTDWITLAGFKLLVWEASQILIIGAKSSSLLQSDEQEFPNCGDNAPEFTLYSLGESMERSRHLG